ncbi:UNVERIFIED_CONTAM: hypothetical protein Scaly_0063500 [Sesamum calycinum]|uniref:Uncharacterized protein n=1 Tax=Sesamum calycinum TaxID=2727403 RepID=A0AAW2SX53_9LAMI
MDELKEINLGDVENPWPIYISTLLTDDEEKAYVELMHEFKDVFAWTYKEMPGLDLKVVVHQLSIKKGARPVELAQRRSDPSWSLRLKLKSINSSRLGSFERDLNGACPKDDFPLPITELMINATMGHEALSFMDGSSRYNQIRIVPKDEKLMALRTPKGIYYYKVMSFGLKNTDATYQRAMKIFDDMLLRR